MKKCALLLLALALLCASGCRQGVGEYPVYRVVDSAYRDSGELLRAETLIVSTEDGPELIDALIAALNSPPGDAVLSNPLPEGAEILSYSLEGGLLTVEAGEAYAELEGLEKTLCDGCLALTLCAVDGVSSVAVEVAGEPVTPPLSPEDLLLYDAASSGGTQ